WGARAFAWGVSPGMPVRPRSNCVPRLCRSAGGVGFFADIDRAQPELAKERHEPEAKHIERCQPCGDDANGPEHGPSGRTVIDRAENLVLAEEAGQGREPG